MELCEYHVNGLLQDCSIYIADALEILQSRTKPLICYGTRNVHPVHK